MLTVCILVCMLLRTPPPQGQFELYLKSLDCPYVGNHVQALSWLLGTALQLEEHSGISDKNPHHQDAFTNIDGKSKKKMSLSIIGTEKSRRFFLPDMEQKSRGLFFLSDVGGDFLLFYTEFLQHLSVLNWPLQPLQPLKITCRFFKFTFRKNFSYREENSIFYHYREEKSIFFIAMKKN